MGRLLDWIPAFAGMTGRTNNWNLRSIEDSLSLAFAFAFHHLQFIICDSRLHTIHHSQSCHSSLLSFVTRLLSIDAPTMP